MARRRLQDLIERTSLHAWPALHEEHLGGWLLRFADGYTKRANSATLVDAGAPDMERQVVECESRYRRAGLPPIFRLTSPTAPDSVDALLAARGYRLIEPTLVLHRLLDQWPSGVAEPIRPTGPEAWLESYCRLHDVSLDLHGTHRRIIQSIRSSVLFAIAEANGHAVACGLGVLEEDRFGLFDLITSRDHRRHGHGRRLVRGMIDWALARGAARAYLQVTRDNGPARALYAALGFDELYRYWYRVPPLPTRRAAKADPGGAGLTD